MQERVMFTILAIAGAFVFGFWYGKGAASRKPTGSRTCSWHRLPNPNNSPYR